MTLSRRTMLGLGAGALGVGLPLSFLLRGSRAVPKNIRPDPERLVDLAEGFSYVVLDRTGDGMSDGFLVPGRPDGMGVFPSADGKLVLMRNHELTSRDRAISAYPSSGGYDVSNEAFDRASFGGVTRLLVDPTTLTVLESNLVLTGTNVNCAGGASPWGWLSCEEDVSEGHGFVFACDPAVRAVAAPQRIPAYGRFRHEAAVVDPATLIAYLTEDRSDAAFYRFVPSSTKDPFEGRLQALALEDDAADTALLVPGERRTVRWIDVPDPTPREDTVRDAARKAGAAIVRRGEGISLTQGSRGIEVHFTATTGGKTGTGQVLRLRPDGDGGELDVVFACDGEADLDSPDNVCVGGQGQIFLAEDGRGPNGIRVLLPDGRIRAIAVSSDGGEIAGLCLSPSGDVLFANLQQRGVTIAIRGSFDAIV